jgi:rubrerythrin
MSISADLKQSMSEERKAARAYRTRGKWAELEGDGVTARLYEHIAKEEDGHYAEFQARLKKLEASRIRRKG